MTAPRNTAKADPVEKLFVAAGGIEAQEARGQRELVESTVLPRPSWVDAGEDPDAPYRELGFRFGEPVGGDDLFRQAELPEGWKREGSDHSMWSYIVDAEGFRRVAIFYKAAFYDRRAEMHIVRVPETRAQAEAYERASERAAGSKSYDRTWRQGTHRREGDNLVYVFVGIDPENFDHSAGEFTRDGRYREVVIDKDGNEVELRDREPEQAA